MREIIKSEPESLPGEWDTIEVGSVCRIESGYPFESKFFNEKEGVPLIRIRDVHSGHSKTLYSGPYDEKYVVNNGDLLVGMDGEFRVCKWGAGKGLLNQRVCRLVPDVKRIDRDFVQFSIGIPLKKIEDYTPYTTVKHISATQIRAIVLPHPSLREQQKIADVLGVVQRAMDQEEALLSLTAELKKGLLHQLFIAGLRGEPQKQTEIGPVPQSWEPTPLGNCSDIISGSLSYTDFLKMVSVDDGDAVECMGVKVSDMNLSGNENKFVTANAMRRIAVATAQHKLVPANSVVFPKRGAAIATNKKRLTTTWTALDPNLIGVRPKDALDPNFLFHWVQTFDLRRITDPGPTPQLNKKDLIPVLIPLPKELNEQREIADVISTVDQKLSLHQAKYDALTALFRTLLHQLMTGQTRIGDLNLMMSEGAFDT